jgi:SAM-dependent methyltransferase
MQIAMGAIVTNCVNVVTRLNVPDLVKRYGAMNAADIMSKGGIDADASALERVLRACASMGVFTEDSAGRFGPTELSDVLSSDSPASVKNIVELFAGPIARVASELPGSVKTGRPQVRRVFGMEWWDYLNANPKDLEEFAEAMKSNSLNSLRGVLECCDFSGVSKVADIGGGFGHLAIALLEKYPHLEATVMDVPDLIPVARARLASSNSPVADRVEFIAGDMFASVPPADVYILKHIIHDWEDEKCIRLLDNCRRGLRENGRVISVDAVVPPMGNTAGTPAKLTDIVMMTFITGKERTEEQWASLYRSAGLEICSITPIHDNLDTSIVEGVPLRK